MFAGSIGSSKCAVKKEKKAKPAAVTVVTTNSLPIKMSRVSISARGLARTTGGRLNDYVTTNTVSTLRKNNNQGIGRTLRPSEIKEGVEARKTEGKRVGDWFHGDNQGGCKHAWLLISNCAAEWGNLQVYCPEKHLFPLWVDIWLRQDKHLLVLYSNINQVQNIKIKLKQLVCMMCDDEK